MKASQKLASTRKNTISKYFDFIKKTQNSFKFKKTFFNDIDKFISSIKYKINIFNYPKINLIT